MNDQPLSASTTDAFRAYRREQARASRLRGRQREARAETGRVPAAHPLQFDERGFPVAQSDRGGLSERIRRLLATPQNDSFHRTEKP
jgi:hypothetical protein